MAILQDTRWRFDSGGEFYPFRHEASDGYDTIEWAAALPCSDGRVGMFGGSRIDRAQQTIYHDTEHPSAIVLPIIPQD